MEIGHIFNIDDIEYCICDIKEIGNKTFAYALSGEEENTKITFFQLKYDDEGVLIEEIVNDNLIAELLKVFVNNN